MATLLLFPNDPLAAHLAKGEVKPRYFNPSDLFTDIHVFSFAEREAQPSEVAVMFGSAKVTIHALPRINIVNHRKVSKMAAEIAEGLGGDIVRSYGPTLRGYAAYRVASSLKIPFVLSVHGDYDRDERAVDLRMLRLGRYLKLLYTSLFVESQVIQGAHVVLPAYKYVEPYVRKRGAERVQTIYNKIFLKDYGIEVLKESTFTVLSVGRLEKPKNHKVLIEAMQGIEGVLRIVGNGVLLEDLRVLSRRLRVQTEFMTRVEHSEMAKIYKSSHVFAIAMRYGGISIPVLEAMAAGLPLVLPKENLGADAEVVDGAALLVSNNAKAFNEAFHNLKDPALRSTLGDVARERSKRFDASVIEDEEADVYRSLLGQG